MSHLTRDLGFVNKFYWGLTGNAYDSDGPKANLGKSELSRLHS